MIELGRDSGALGLINVVVEVTRVKGPSRRRSKHERRSSARPTRVSADVAVVLIKEIVGLSDAILLYVLVCLVDFRPPQAVSKVIVDGGTVERRIRRRVVAFRLTRPELAFLAAVINKAVR